MSVSHSVGSQPTHRPVSPSSPPPRENLQERVITTAPPMTRESHAPISKDRKINWIEEEEKEEEAEDLQITEDNREIADHPSLDRHDSSSSINSTDSLDSTAPLPRHRSSCLRMVARRVRSMALPSMALLAAANAPGVEAGPAMFAACIAGCTTSGPLAPGCYVLCSIALGAPTP